MSERCDVLVIGAGGAALRAALAAYESAPDSDIVIVTKGKLGQSGVTATACSDRMAFHATLPTTEPGGPDAWRYHADDIYRIGGYVSDADLAQVLARGAAEAFDYLDKLGVPWARREDGVVSQFVTDGSIYARACYTGPHTANHIEEALVRRLRQTPIRVVEEHMAAELLLDETRQRVIGAALVSQADGRISAIATKAVVLATGGAGQVFAINVFPPDCTGDGYALAYRAGAELVNMEFIQIGLCSLKTLLACSGSMMRALPRLVNDLDEEFLPRYFASGTSYAEMYEILFAKGASWPVSSREPSHIIDIAVAAEIARGRRVFLDYSRDPIGLEMSALSERVRSRYTSNQGAELDASQMSSPLARLKAINRPSVDWLAERGVVLDAGDMVEIAPAVQHFQGGVKIRTHAETAVRGLYAAGEVAGGQHGANRPGGNALMDSQVFGRVAGESAARFAQKISDAPAIAPQRAEQAVAALCSSSGDDPTTIREQVRLEMSRLCSVYRTEVGLRALCDLLSGLNRRGVRPSGAPLAQTIETINILQVANVIANAALERDESRGPHLRFPPDGSLKPLPTAEPAWNRYIVARAGLRGLALERREPIVEDIVG